MNPRSDDPPPGALEPRLLVSRPHQVAPQQLARIRSLVVEAGEVSPEGLSERLNRCRLLAYLVQGDDIVSVAAIKEPEVSYLTGLLAKSGYDVTRCGAELGYFHTQNGYQGRGYAKQLAAVLVPRLSHPSFATTREDNPAMQHILGKHGFRCAGRPWPSTRAPATLLGLWVRE